jgi:hypothetical protein
MTSVEVRWSGRRWLLLEAAPLPRSASYLLRLSCRGGERSGIVRGTSVGDVMQRAIDWIGEMIAPAAFDYCRFSCPELDG